MKQADFFSRLEIAFWIEAVKIMKRMKERRALLSVSFLVFLSLCLVVGAGLVLPAGAHKPVETKAAVSLPATAISEQVSPTLATVSSQATGTGQRNTLLILVDQLSAKGSHLEGVWLVAQLPHHPQVTLLPVYPSVSLDAQAQDMLPVDLFSLTLEGVPSPAFLDAIRSKDFWWDDLLVLDRVALAEFVDLAGGVDLAHGRLDGALAVAKLPAAAESSQEALKGQSMLAGELCRKASQIISAYNQAAAINNFPGHVYSEPELGQIFANWSEVGEYGSSLSCQLPTLQEAFRHAPTN